LTVPKEPFVLKEPVMLRLTVFTVLPVIVSDANLSVDDVLLVMTFVVRVLDVILLEVITLDVNVLVVTTLVEKPSIIKFRLPDT